MRAKQVYVGKVIALAPMAGADRLERAQVACGTDGGVWWGVVVKGDFTLFQRVEVYLQDSLLPPEDPRFDFMAQYKFRVKMKKLRGVPSEVLILPLRKELLTTGVGMDITLDCGVRKYEKKLAPSLAGVARGGFPTFLPKTDEPNFQRVPEFMEILRGTPCWVTEKAGGSAMTAYRYLGKFGVCSRNLDFTDTPENAFWKMARKYHLAEVLPEGFALQGELVGPGVQGNPMELPELELWLFNLLEIREKYLSFGELQAFAHKHGLQTVKVLESDALIPKGDDDLRQMAEGFYENGHPREGIVIRPMVEEHYCGNRVSVKVLNLNYKEKH